MEEKPDLKCVLVGHMGTGKTCLFNRICKGIFDPNTTMTVSFCGVKSVRISIEEQTNPVIMSLWDTIGQDRFMAPTRQFTRNSDAAMICCSLNDPDFDLEKAKFWTHIFLKDSPSCKLYLVGTKSDLPRQGKIAQDLQEYANSYNAKYVETSAKEDFNVTSLVKMIARDWVISSVAKTHKKPIDTFKLEETPTASQDRKCGC